MAGHQSSTAAQPPLTVSVILDRAIAAGHAALDEHEAKALLSRLGISTPRGVRLGAPQAAGAALFGLGPPFVLKALSNEAIHKTDIGAVRLGLPDAVSVELARAEIAGRMEAAGKPLSGFLIEEMAAPGIEIVIGGVMDPQLGPMIMVGAGGLFAEILNDVSFRLCPISARDAREMLEELKIAPILHGARGKPEVALDKIEAALLALGGEAGFFTVHSHQVIEFDLNPLIARADGLIAVDARVVLQRERPLSVSEPLRVFALDDFRPLFAPETIAVVGASATGTTAGNRFLRLLRSNGYPGRIFPIHPTAAQIEGFAAYPTLAEMPEIADYAYLTVPANRAEEVLGLGAGKLRFAQVMASADPQAHQEWEKRLRGLAQDGGFRIVGPNCMGTHSPRGRYTFMEGAILEEGSVGIACQSGGLGMDILRRGQNLGLRFSGLVTLGNSIDVDPSDLLDYCLQDAHTKVVGLYVEDVKDGRRFQKLARRNCSGKPVVLLVGGVTGLGRTAAASHTGALGGTNQAWTALARQTGMVLTDSLDTFLDALQLCLWLTPKPATRTPEVTLFGNGGGTSVLATDSLDRAGFRLASPPAEARARYAEIALPAGASLANPIDLPASVLKEQDGNVTARILDIDRHITKPYATIVHLNLPVILGYRHVADFLPNLMNSVFGPIGDAAAAPHRILVMRSDRSEEADEWRRSFRTMAAERGVATFDEIPQAIDALAAFRRYESFLTAMGETSRFPRVATPRRDNG